MVSITVDNRNKYIITVIKKKIYTCKMNGQQKSAADEAQRGTSKEKRDCTQKTRREKG